MPGRPVESIYISQGVNTLSMLVEMLLGVTHGSVLAGVGRGGGPENPDVHLTTI